MGLDMYLYRKLYVKNWEHMKPAEKHTISVKYGGKVRKDVKPSRISEITEEVMYWRKANHIHKWFVDNVQGGKDDCGEYEVSREQLQTLQELCQRVIDSTKLIDGEVTNGYSYEKDKDGEFKRIPNIEKGKVMEDPSVAKNLLPTQEGFFFGNYDYNQWYYEDTRRTAEGIKALLEEPVVGDAFRQGTYYYHSSW